MEKDQIKPGTAYHSVDFGMNHYYLQRTDDVLHINHSHPLINQLDINYISRFEGSFKEVPVDEFYQLAKEVLTALGFTSETLT